MSSSPQEEVSNSLKRKNEVGVEEQNLEAGIKRVALEDDLNNADTSSFAAGSVTKPVTDLETPGVSAENPTATTNIDTDGADIDNEGDDSNIVSTASQSEDSHNSSDTSGSQVSSSDTVHLRMLCLVKEAGFVVGPKGETISRIKSETKARINVSNNIRGVPERVIYVKGTCDSVAKAFGMIARTLIVETQEMNRRRQGSSNREEEKEEEEVRSELGVAENADSDEEGLREDREEDKTAITLHLLIPHHLMGYVIGKRGSRLKEIEELSAAKLLASPDQLVPSNDRLLQVTGVPDAIHIATFYVAQTIAIFKDSRKNRKSVYYQPGPAFSVLNGTMGINGFTGGVVGNGIRYGQNARSNSLPYPTFRVSPVGFMADPQLPQGRYQFFDSRYAPPVMRSGGSGVSKNNNNNNDNNSNNFNANGNGNGNDTDNIHDVNGNSDANSNNINNSNNAQSNDSQSQSHSHSHGHDPRPLGSPLIIASHHQGALANPGPIGIIPGSVVYTPETVANAMSFVPNYTIPNVHIVERPFPTQRMAIVQQEIYIDENYVGNIIGKEGRHINSIKRTTGCSIYIDPPVEGSHERKLTIKGTAMGSQAAIMLISNKIELDRANSNNRHRSNNQSLGTSQ